MSFSDHKITKFTHTVSELPDQPSLPPKDLKARFDSSPEELREAVNGICDDAERLDKRVSGIVAQTFEDAIPKTMLSNELQAELDDKAEESSVASRLAAVSSAVAQKCEVYFGAYTGDGQSSKTVHLGFTPKALLVLASNGATVINTGANTYVGGLALEGRPAYADISHINIEIVPDGFKVYYTSSSPYARANSGQKYFIAFR